MGGTTISGWPYITPDDHPKEFPAHSQALANMLESQRVGGVIHASSSVPSSTTADNALTVAGTPATWGGVTANSSSLVVPVKGWYLMTAHAVFGTSGTGTIRLVKILNSVSLAPPAGSNVIGAHTVPSANAGPQVPLSCSGIWNVNAGDAFRPYLRQDSGASMTISATFTLQLIRAT
jgi:hypothetical protein